MFFAKPLQRSNLCASHRQRRWLTHGELAWQITDTQDYFISESSVNRILKRCDLITSPAYIVMSARDRFQYPTRRVNELWQTDFTYFRVVGWGWYYLSTVLDDYSRYIIAWLLRTSMQAGDVTETLDLARARTGVDRVRPRLLSDNGPAYLSGELATYLATHGMAHTRGAPYHPMTQGKIERDHRSLKNIVKLEKYYRSADVDRAGSIFRHGLGHWLGGGTPQRGTTGRFRTLLLGRRSWPPPWRVAGSLVGGCSALRGSCSMA